MALTMLHNFRFLIGFIKTLKGLKWLVVHVGVGALPLHALTLFSHAHQMQMASFSHN